MARKGVRVSKHSRTPRGSDRGKGRPNVRAHRRKRPAADSYPRPNAGGPGRKRK